MSRSTLLSVTLVILSFAANSAAQTVPGFVVEEYALVTDPMKLSFDAAGNLFAGRDNSGSGGGFGDAVKIHRIDSGGSPVSEYGAGMIPDPDAVIVDVDGIFGVPGAVLMGGIISNAMGGQIAAVLPNETVVGLFGPTTSFHNPSDFAFTSTGQLLFTNHSNPSTSTHGVFESIGLGDAPALLFATTVNIAGMAIDPSDRIYVSTDDGRVQRYDLSGALLDANFVTGLGAPGAPLAVGQLDGAPLSLYTVDSLGNLLEVDMLGNEVMIGSGFASITNLAFGPGGDLYISEHPNDRVLRVPEPSVIAGIASGIGLLALLRRRRALSDGRLQVRPRVRRRRRVAGLHRSGRNGPDRTRRDRRHPSRARLQRRRVSHRGATALREGSSLS